MDTSQAVDVILTGVDGSRWYLSGPGSRNSPVVMTEGSVGDLFDPPTSTHFKPRAGQHGTTFRGFRTEERNIVLNVLIGADSAFEWQRVDSDFRRAFSYEDEATLAVRTPISGERTLKVRLAEAPKYQWDVDPNIHSSSLMEFVVVAVDPFWRSNTITDEYVFDGTNWYGDSVTVTNPGDVPVWPKWVLTAPAKFILPDVSFREDSDKERTIVLPFQPLGSTALVDTDPLEELIATSDDRPVWAEMNGQFFQHPIPAHTPETEIPIGVDPMPNLPLAIPDGWKQFISSEVSKWATNLGQGEVLKRTPKDLAQVISSTIRNSSPPFLRPLSDPILDFLQVEKLADLITEAYGSTNNMAGATAQVIVEHKWTRPWGMEG